MGNSRSMWGNFLPSGGAMSAVTSVEDLIPHHYGQRRNAAKILALICDVSVRTAKNWLAKKNMPQIGHWVPLCAHDDALHRDFQRIIAEERSRCERVLLGVAS